MTITQTPDIFVLDDDPIIRANILFMLERENYVAKEFDLPELFIAELFSAESLPRFIISDYQMPGMNGIEIIQMLKKSPRLKHIPVLIISSYSDSIIKNEALQVGAVEWLEKATFVKNILPAVEKYILPNDAGEKSPEFQNEV